MALYHHDWRETRKPWGLALHGFDIPVNIGSIGEKFKNKNSKGKCSPSVCIIDEISLLPHTHLLLCYKECMMIWECKQIIARHKHTQIFKGEGGWLATQSTPPVE